MQNSSKKPKSDLLRLSVTLFLIAGIMALMVAFINNITAPEILKRNELQTKDALSSVMTDATLFNAYQLDFDNVVSADGKDVAVHGAWAALKDAKQIGVCVKVAPKGYGGDIEMIVAVDMDGKVVNSQIISMSETSGIGTKINDESFLSQFIGKIKGITAGTDENSIQTVSGATKSSKAYLRGINAALDVTSKVLGGKDDE